MAWHDSIRARIRQAGGRRTPGLSSSTVLLVAYHSDSIGGGQVNLLRLVEHLIGGAFQPIVIVKQEGPVADTVRRLGVRVEVVDLHDFSLYSWSHWRGAARAARALRKIIRRYRPFVIYVDGTEHVAPVWYAARFTGAKLLWHVQTVFSHHLDQLNQRLADALVLCSEATGERFSEGPRASRHLIFNAVDVDRFTPGEALETRQGLGLSPDDTMLLSVGQINPRKGQGDLIEALALLSARPGSYKAVFVGKPLGDERNRLKVKACALGMEPHVRWIEQCEDVASLMRAADIFVFPSHAEGMSLALLEAMASGCAIVASDIPGNAEALGEGGIYAPVKDPAALADAIEMMRNDPVRAARLRRYARQRAAENFDMGRFFRGFEEVLAALGDRAPLNSGG